MLELAVPERFTRFELDKDAFDKQHGCVYMQKHSNGKLKLSNYWQRALSNLTESHDTVHRDCIAAFQAAHLLQLYSKSTKSSVRTDQDDPKGILNVLGAAGKLAHWRFCLYEL